MWPDFKLEILQCFNIPQKPCLIKHQFKYSSEGNRPRKNEKD